MSDRCVNRLKPCSVHPIDYEELLSRAPDHDSPEFIDFLIANNEVIRDDRHFITIANCKYDRPEARWYTVFWKHSKSMQNSMQFNAGLLNVLNRYPDWEWLKKSADKQTVKRFHIHIYQK